MKKLVNYKTTTEKIIKPRVVKKKIKKIEHTICEPMALTRMKFQHVYKSSQVHTNTYNNYERIN